MEATDNAGRSFPFSETLLALTIVGLVTPAALGSEAGQDVGETTFNKDIAPILQRSCQQCHKPDSVAPMSLITYEQVRPWAKTIKRRTHMGPVAGVMPPWYIETDIGIQHYQYDPSLSEEELAKIARWVDTVPCAATRRTSPRRYPWTARPTGRSESRT